MTKADESRASSPEDQSSSGNPPPEGVKSESSGDPKAVPYHRFREKVLQAQELSEKLNNLEREVQELRQRPTPSSEEVETPDRDDDPVGYAEHVAEQARKTAQTATERIESYEAERKHQALLRDLQDEFAGAVAKYPGIDADEDMREHAWRIFVMDKDRTQGKATGEDIMASLHSRFQTYADTVSGKNPERDKLRGKPKSEEPPAPRKKAWEKDRDIPQGERQPMTGRMSFSTKLDKAMNSKTREVMERIAGHGKRTAGL